MMAVEPIRLSRKVMARGRSDYLRKVWRFTGGPGAYWWVYGMSDSIWRRTHSHMFGCGVDREEDGWKEIVLELYKEVSVKCTQFPNTNLSHLRTVQQQSQGHAVWRVMLTTLAPLGTGRFRQGVR